MELTVCLLALGFIRTGLAARRVSPPCDQRDVDKCLSDFNISMETSGFQDRCTWPAVKRVYHELKTCVDVAASMSRCEGRGFLADKVFLAVHRTYFSLCGQVHNISLIRAVMS